MKQIASIIITYFVLLITVLPNPGNAQGVNDDLSIATHGYFRTRGREIEVETTKALYDPVKNEIKLLFFPQQSSNRSSSSNEHRKSIPIAMLTTVVKFPRNSNRCQLSSIQDITSEQAGTKQPIDGGSFKALSCSFISNSIIEGSFASNNNKKGAFGWDIKFSAVLQIAKNNHSVALGAKDFQDHLALLLEENRQKIVQVGYFDSVLSGSDKEQVADQKSLFALRNSPPRLVMELKFGSNTRELSLEKLESYSVTFYRGGEVIDFPGTDNKLRFDYLIGSRTPAQVSNLSGKLAKDSDLTGIFSHYAKVSISEIPCKFTWNIDLKSKLLDGRSP